MKPFTEEQKRVRNERARAWNAANKERVKENQLRYREKNPDRVKKWASDYKQRHPEANVARVREFVKSRPWYWTWTGAKQRCTNPKHPGYKYYGGRGIKFSLSEEEIKSLWIRDNAESMNKPSIDRINNNGHYEISNCRFIELSDNSRKALVERALRRKALKEARSIPLD